MKAYYYNYIYLVIKNSKIDAVTSRYLIPPTYDNASSIPDEDLPLGTV